MNSPPPLPSKDSHINRSNIPSQDIPPSRPSHSSNTPTETTETTPLSQNIDLDLPNGIDEAKITVIQQLTDSPQILQGLYETSTQGKDTFESQKQLAEKNIERAKHLLNQLDDITTMRDQVQKSLESTRCLEQDWFKIEQQMYRELQPFSSLGLKSKLESAVRDSESLSNGLVNSFLDGTGTDSIEDFIKQYRQERKTFHLRKEKLQRWNEDRVS